MDEYQAATLAIRTYALWAAYGQVAATVLIGGGQIAVVLYGIRAMIRANRERAVILDQQHQADERRHKEAMAEGARRHEQAMAEGARRHEETMAAFAESARADDKRHEEAMAALDELVRDGQRQAAALDESIQASQRQTAALDELLRRSAPAE